MLPSNALKRLAAVVVICLTPVTAHPAGASTPLELVGSYDPGTPGQNASVAALDGVAYLGGTGAAARCLDIGVRLVDVSNPSAPLALGTAAAYPRMITEHLAAIRMDTRAFGGNVLLAGIQRCAPLGDAGGLSAWDVSDPQNPRELSYLEVGLGPRGVHEFAVSRRGESWYAYLAVPNSDLYGERGDLRIVDITDPAKPVEVANWSAPRDAHLPAGRGEQCAPDCRGTIPQAFLHSVAVSPDGRTAYLSYWDLGMLVLDVSEPGAPRYLGRFAEPSDAEGNTHSASVAHGGKLALVADETFAPPWGALRLVDVQNPSSPVQVGTFRTSNCAAGTQGAWYSVHSPLVDDRDPNRAYLAWYSDGVRLVDLSDPSGPVELASWVPSRAPLVWNVALMGDLLLVADMNTGLYVLRR